jgi:hypothetical protein
MEYSPNLDPEKNSGGMPDAGGGYAGGEFGMPGLPDRNNLMYSGLAASPSALIKT